MFLTVEPEVILLGADETRRDLTLQVVFKGMDKLSVKFEFNTERDTAEDVVSEMVCVLLLSLFIFRFYRLKKMSCLKNTKRSLRTISIAFCAT